MKKLDNKCKGEYGELLFAAEAAKQGLVVLFPNGDSAQYDFVIDTGRQLLRIQVKSSTRDKYSIKLGGINRANSSYTRVDYFAFVDLNSKDIFLVPFASVKGTKLISTISSITKKFLVYKNNWQLSK